MGGVQIREMTAHDLDAVCSIASSLKDAPHWPRSAYQVALNPMAWPKRIALVAADEKEGLAGFAIAALVAPTEAELESIAVTAVWQRRGVARELFAELAPRLRARGIEVIFLEVRESNTAARAFYLTLGFSLAGRRTGYYADPAEDALVMRLDVPNPS